MNNRYILFCRRSSSFIREAHFVVIVCLRTIAKQEKSGGHGRNFWQTDQLYTFITASEVEKTIIIAFPSFFRHVLFNVHQFQSFECLYKIAYLTLYISVFHYTLLKLLNDNHITLRIVIRFCLNRLNWTISGHQPIHAQHKPRWRKRDKVTNTDAPSLGL